MMKLCEQWEQFLASCMAAADTYKTDRYSADNLLERLLGNHRGMRTRELVSARADVIAEMVAVGCSEPTLGRWLNIDHSAINCYKSRHKAKAMATTGGDK